MNLPTANRKPGIIQTLDYAELQRQQLSQALLDSYKIDGELPKYVSQVAGNILANARECFDHLGKDLIEGHLLPVAKPSFVSTYNSGKRGKYYFPFYRDQITNPQLPFHQFKRSNRALYDDLHDFIDALDKDLCIPNTGFRVENFRLIADMVNEKKHSHVLEYRAEANEKVFVEASSDSFLFDKDFRNDNPYLQVVLPNGAVPRPVAAYRFACNGRDVWDICLFAVRATQILMDMFYDKYFAATEKVYKPEPAPTITVSSEPPPGFR